jgi:hypothetical protein
MLNIQHMRTIIEKRILNVKSNLNYVSNRRVKWENEELSADLKYGGNIGKTDYILLS